MFKNEVAEKHPGISKDGTLLGVVSANSAQF